MAVRRIILGQLVGKMIIIIIIIITNLAFHTSKNKNVDQQGKEDCAWESDHVTLLCDSTMPSAINFYFYFYPFYCNPKEEDNIRIKINSKTKVLVISIIILISQKLVLVGPIQQKLSCLCLKINKYKTSNKYQILSLNKLNSATLYESPIDVNNIKPTFQT